MHYAEVEFSEAIKLLCTKKGKVSSHYIIHRNGRIYSLVADEKRAWHAGISYWKGEDNLNHSSIGIEIDNNGNEAFSKDQMDACIYLCKHLVKKHNIPNHNIIGHSDIAPDRKVDPGPLFDWRKLAMNDIGMWPRIEREEDVAISNITSRQQKLNKFGYKINVTGKLDLQTIQVMKAFQAHFNPDSLSSLNEYKKLDGTYANWNQEDERILDNLLANYY